MEVLERILKAAMQAPSAHNRQPWRFAVLIGPNSKERLAQMMGEDFECDLLADGVPPDDVWKQVDRSRRRITQAPVVVLLSLDETVGDSYPDPERQSNELLMMVQGVAMAGENLLLAAHALGLGGVWMCAPLFAQDTVREALDIPDSWQPQGLILLGYPATIPKERPRQALDEVSRFYLD